LTGEVGRVVRTLDGGDDMAVMSGRDAARLAYGAGLLLAPDVTAGALAGRRLDGRSRLVVRVLGARHVTQALVLRSQEPGSTLRRLGRATDLLHAGSMALLAALAPGWERAALTDAALEVLIAGPAQPRPPKGPGTKVVGPLPEDVFNDDESRARRQQDDNASRQLAIYDALMSMDGAGLEGARRALRESLAARELAEPPLTWLDAVASELAQGRIYVVSGTSLQDAGILADRGHVLAGPVARVPRAIEPTPASSPPPAHPGDTRESM
jgi:hypothetical protein